MPICDTSHGCVQHKIQLKVKMLCKSVSLFTNITLSRAKVCYGNATHRDMAPTKNYTKETDIIFKDLHT